MTAAGKSDERDDRKKDRDEPRKTNPEVIAGEMVLKIEILGNKRVEKLAGKEAAAADRRYRVATDNGLKFMALGEVDSKLNQPAGSTRTV